jgi:hypothetical protein
VTARAAIVNGSATSFQGTCTYALPATSARVSLPKPAAVFTAIGSSFHAKSALSSLSGDHRLPPKTGQPLEQENCPLSRPPTRWGERDSCDSTRSFKCGLPMTVVNRGFHRELCRSDSTRRTGLGSALRTQRANPATLTKAHCLL